MSACTYSDGLHMSACTDGISYVLQGLTGIVFHQAASVCKYAMARLHQAPSLVEAGSK